MTIFTTPRSGNAAYALPLRVLTTTPLGPSVTPTWAPTRGRADADSRCDRESNACRGDSHRGRRNVLWPIHTDLNSVLSSIVGVVAWLLVLPGVLAAQPPAAPRPRVLAFFTAGGELDHVLFAQQAMRALTAEAADGGYAFAATTDWDALNDANLRDVRLVIWLNDMPHTPAQRQAFERYMTGGGAWLGFHVSGFGNAAWPWFTEFMGGSRFAASNWPSLPARVNVDDVEHPIVKGVPATFVAPINEWYAWTPSPRVNPTSRCC